MTREGRRATSEHITAFRETRDLISFSVFLLFVRPNATRRAGNGSPRVVREVERRRRNEIEADSFEWYLVDGFQSTFRRFRGHVERGAINRMKTNEPTSADAFRFSFIFIRSGLIVSTTEQNDNISLRPGHILCVSRPRAV